MKLYVVIGALGLAAACGEGQPCDPLDAGDCEPDMLCEYGSSGAHCRTPGRLGVAQGELEPCGEEMPCLSGFVCLSYSCVDGALALSAPSRDLTTNGCLPLCDSPSPARLDQTGRQCVAFDPKFGAPSHGLDLTVELLAQACEQL